MLITPPPKRTGPAGPTQRYSGAQSKTGENLYRQEQPGWMDSRHIIFYPQTNCHFRISAFPAEVKARRPIQEGFAGVPINAGVDRCGRRLSRTQSRPNRSGRIFFPRGRNPESPLAKTLRTPRRQNRGLLSFSLQGNNLFSDKKDRKKGRRIEPQRTKGDAIKEEEAGGLCFSLLHLLRFFRLE